MTAPAPQATRPSPYPEELLVQADRAAIIATLARGMAHDLRGSLQAFSLMADPNVDLLTGPELGQLRGAVSKSVERMSGTISLFSQEFAPVQTEPSPLIVPDLLGHVAKLLGYQRGLPSAALDRRVAHGLPPVRGIEAEVRHLLLSLVINARQALADRSDGRILLAAELEGGGVRLVVEDNGPGLGPVDRVRVFEPFFTTRRDSLGIGLTVARWLAERQGGRVALEEGPAGGVKAVVTLQAWPRAQAESR